jgi:hypothetical protein
MSTIVTRAGKGSPLTNTECDANFTNLNTDKLEINAALGTPASVTLTNATGLPTAGLVDNAVTDAKLRDSGALSVIGRGANSTGDPADISAGANHQVLRRDGSSLGFGAVDLSSNQAVTGTLPVNQGGTGITSFGSGVATFLATPSSANLATAVTDETGTGALVFGTNPVIDGTTIPARTNPLAQAVSVQMTAAASGSNGIRQVDNDNLDFNISDFSIGCILSIPDWTPASSTYIYVKRQGGSDYIQFRLNSNGTLLLVILIGGVTIINATSTTSVPVTSGAAFITASVVRETASSDGSVTFYANGVQVGAALVISAAATASISNTGSSEWGGWNGSRSAISFLSGSLFNRALTAAEVLDLSINGPALADRGASQTNLITGDSSDFEGGTLGSWVDNSVAPTSLAVNLISPLAGADDLLCSSTTNTNSGFNLNIGTTRAGVRYRIQFIYKSESGSNWTVSLRETTSGTSAVPSTTTLSGSTTLTSDGTLREFFWEFQPAATTSNTRLLFKNTAGAIQSIQADNFDYKVIGLTSELLASNAQSNTGQIFDTSGNKNHALLPASGATVVGCPVSQTREVRWTNTWAGTNELQYIGGVNQAILPANAYIDSIVGTVSGATPHDIIIGDGSDADRYVTITTGLAAGTTSFTLANRTTDGTNLKLTADPDTDCTMSIAWVIKYTTLES